MSSPREIADARLARGDITPAEHEALIARLASVQPSGPQPAPPPVPPAYAAPPPVPPAYVPPPAYAYAQPQPQPAPYAAAAPAPQRSGSKAGWWIGGGVAALLLVLVVAAATNETIGGLSVGNVAAEPSLVTFRLANGRAQGGDVLLWVEQNDLRMCEHVARVRANMTYNMRVNCPTLQSGRFNIYTKWADTDPDMTRIAIRIPVN